MFSNGAYSMVPNNSAARLLIFKIFSPPTRLIWTYTLIKIQIIFLPTRLLSTIFYFFIYFQCFLQPFFVTNASIMHFFIDFPPFICFQVEKSLKLLLKRPTHLSHFEKFLPKRLLGTTRLLNFKISSNLHCY